MNQCALKRQESCALMELTISKSFEEANEGFYSVVFFVDIFHIAKW